MADEIRVDRVSVRLQLVSSGINAEEEIVEMISLAFAMALPATKAPSLIAF